MQDSQEKPFVSVIVALKNEIQFVEKCCISLLHQTYKPRNYEILLFDGLSTDGTKEYLLEMKQRYSQLKVFDNPKEVAAAGWNMGFKMSKAKYVVMMGGHTFVNRDFIEKNVEILEKEDVPCSGGIVTAIGQDTISRAISLAFNHPFGAGSARYRFSKKKCYVETINYGMYRKSVIDTIGPINESIKRGEDWEFNFRIITEFGKMLFSPEIKSFYYARSTFRELWKRQYDAGKYKLEIIRNYPRSLLLRHITPFFFILLMFVLILFSALSQNYIYLFIFFMIYLLVNILISIYISTINSFIYIPLIMWAFFIIQFAYGFGFLRGIFDLIKNLWLRSKK